MATSLKQDLTAIAFYLALLLLILGWVFYMLDGLLETVEIRPNSIKSWTMVPDLLKKKELEQLGQIEKYTYTPADNSPEVTAVYILAHGSKELIEKRVLNFFAQNSFIKVQHPWEISYSNGKEYLSFFLEKKGDTEWLVNISLSDY